MSTVLRADRLKEDKHDRTKRLKWFDMEKVSKAGVLIVGAGALGNEVCKDLVLAGYRKISIIDMDYVIRSNLNRCILFTDLDADKKRLKVEVVAERLKQIEPAIELNISSKKIEEMGEDFIPSHDIVLGCVDNISTRVHLNAHCYHYNIPYIDGGISGFLGKVQVIVPPKTPCLECGMNKTHMKVLEKRFSCTGTDITFYEAKLPAEISTTSIIAGVQVREAIKITNNYGNLIEHLFYYDGLRNVSDVLEIDISPKCPHHKKSEKK